MIHVSPRPLADLAEGLINGCNEHFGENTEIQRENIAEDGTSVCSTVTKQG